MSATKAISVAGMPGAAAIFDLDRTLLRTSSTPALNQALFEEGVARRSSLPGQALLMRFYDVFGETLPSMAAARAAALAARGWPVKEVGQAAQLAADLLQRQVLPYVPALLEAHRAAGRVLVLATTTPYDMVAPLSERLGIEVVIATRYGRVTDKDGIERFSGRIEGGFVWSVGKLQAVQRWAREAGIDLRQSWAYSDSVYDVPLLAAVGHPTVVNPDFRLLAAALVGRWPVTYLDSPPGVPKLFGVEPMDMVRLIVQPAMFPFVRFDIAGTENIPRRGPAIVAANHRSYFDPIAYGLAAFNAGRNPRGLAKKEMFDAPIIGDLARASGAICVDRKGSGRSAYEQAEQALRGGEVLIVTPQATIPRGDSFFDPKLRGKSGAARLAAATGAPVIPLGVWGTEEVWPRSSRLPNVTGILHPPTVRVRVGPPVRGLTGEDFEADTERIMAAIAAQLPAEANLRRIPTPEELARTMPPGSQAVP
jgi:putative phosphoserine phosphatase/1-acylglycerol-3-phosphate O-acyltransferase